MKLKILFVLQLWQINKWVQCTPTKQVRYQSVPSTACSVFFIAYDYDTNYIFAKPINNLKDESIIAAFEAVFKELKNRGHKPTFKVTKSQCTKPIKALLQKENCKWQFVEPTNHRVNAAEHAIQMFKNHFISGL